MALALDTFPGPGGPAVAWAIVAALVLGLVCSQGSC